MCLHSAMTCAHSMCSFWGFPQSHVLWSSLSEFFHSKPLSRIHYFLNLELKALAVKLLNKVNVGLSFFFSDELDRNECVNLSEGNNCISCVALTKAVIGKFLIFFSTEFSDSAKLVAMGPHRFPSSHAKVPCSFGIWSIQAVSCGLSSCNSR